MYLMHIRTRCAHFFEELAASNVMIGQELWLYYYVSDCHIVLKNSQ